MNQWQANDVPELLCKFPATQTFLESVSLIFYSKERNHQKLQLGHKISEIIRIYISSFRVSLDTLIDFRQHLILA